MFQQFIGFLGTILFFVSFQCKNKKNMFRVQFLSYLFYTTHLFLIEAYTGGISYILNTVRSFCLSSNSKFAKSKEMCLIICSIQIITLFFTWSGIISLLPIIANIAATVAGYTYNAKKIRAVAMLVNSPLWIIYDVILGSWAGILDEVVTELSNIISIIRFGWNNLDND